MLPTACSSLRVEKPWCAAAPPPTTSPPLPTPTTGALGVLQTVLWCVTRWEVALQLGPRCLAPTTTTRPTSCKWTPSAACTSMAKASGANPSRQERTMRAPKRASLWPACPLGWTTWCGTPALETPATLGALTSALLRFWSANVVKSTSVDGEAPPTTPVHSFSLPAPWACPPRRAVTNLARTVQIFGLG